MLMLRMTLLLALASLVGCTEHSPGFDITNEAPDATTSAEQTGASTTTDTTGAAATTDVVTTTATTGPAATSTGPDEPNPSASSTGEPENAAPKIFAFAVEPAAIHEPGAVSLKLDASADVVDVDVWYGETLIGTVPAAEFPYSFDVTSQSMCDGSQVFTATVRDAEGLTATSPPAELFCQLPAPGSQVYTRTLEGTASAIGTAITLLPDGGVLAGGALDGRMMLWRLDAAGNPVAGWPKTIADWTLVADLDAKESGATAVVVDSTGALVVAGYFKNGIAFRRYVAKLGDKGTLLWEDPGQVDGEEIMGLAVSSAGDVVTAGSRRTSPLDKPPLYDAVTWGYPDGYPYDAKRWFKTFAKPATDPTPDDLNLDSERMRGVLALPSGRFLVFGERDYGDFDYQIYTRTTMFQVSGDGDLVGETWTSLGSQYANDAALAGTLTATGFAFTGWCRLKGPGAQQQLCVQTFDVDGKPGQIYVEPWPTQTAGLGVAQDRMQRLVIAGYKSKPGELDAWVFASIGAGYPPAWQQPPLEQGEWDFATGIVCEAWGKCTWVGTTMINDHAAVVVSQRYP
jgi:hypothetical protein